MENSGQPPPFHRQIGSRVLPSNDPEKSRNDPPPSYDCVVGSQPEKYHPVQLVPEQVPDSEPISYTTTPLEPGVHSYSNPKSETALGHSRPQPGSIDCRVDNPNGNVAQPAPNQTVFVCQRNSGLDKNPRTTKRIVCTVVTIILMCSGATVSLLRMSHRMQEQQMLKDIYAEGNQAMPKWEQKFMPKWDTFFEKNWDELHKEIADEMKVKNGSAQFDNDLAENAKVGNDFGDYDKSSYSHNLSQILVNLRKFLEMEMDNTIGNMNEKKNSSEDLSEVDSNPSKLEETLKEVDKIMKWKTPIP